MNTKESRKLVRAERKAKKLEKRAEKRALKLYNQERIREKYADEAPVVRFFHVHATFIIGLVLIAGLLCAVISGAHSYFTSARFWDKVAEWIFSYKTRVYNAEATPEIYDLSPIDEEGGKRIDKIPCNGEDDTWTFCVYMVGSNLEDDGENDLSDYVKVLVSEIVAENDNNTFDSMVERINRLSEEVEDAGMDMPNYLYKINKPVASSEYVTSDVIATDSLGCASCDIAEMCANSLPDNITIVLQTGGARRWGNACINPNRTQRFVIKNGIMNEDMNMHLQDSCNPDTLADFISYCDKNYHSDHMGLIMWDHGGGVTGYGNDEIFNSSMTMADIHTALSKSLVKNINNPYFDIIGFDACLMATTDTAVCLNGYGKYLASSEETEPGDGWDYTAWLNELAENPTMSAAKVCQEIADSYTDYYMKGNADFFLPIIFGNTAVTFSVVDIEKAAEVDAAYERMNEKFLKLIADNPSVLTDMGRAAEKTMRYSASHYAYFNSIDLGTYLDYLSELYPDECEETRKLLKESVLYTRSNHYLAGSQGLSVYFPATVNSADGLIILADYVYNISQKKCTNALYYYKVTGCLNDEMRENVAEVTGKELKKLNTQIFYDYQKIEPWCNDNDEIVISIGDDLKDSIQSVYVEIAEYDDNNNTITYYGTDDCYEYDDDGNIVAFVDGQWFALNGSLLDAKISFKSETTSTYTAKILHNSIPSYMTFTVNNESGDITIDKVVKIPEEDASDYDAALRVDTELLPGDKITPILSRQDASGTYSEEICGKEIKYKGTSKIELVNLPDGDYLQSVVITDLRGDEYYSPVVMSSMRNGKSIKLETNPSFVGSSN